MNLSPHITLDEFTASSTAARRGINNSLPGALMENATATAQMLERIRQALCGLAGRDIPIIITSGYRCLELNAAVGSKASSDHVQGMACDFKAPAFGTPFNICQALAPMVSVLGIGQLIHEYGQWVHASTRTPASAVNRVITISARGTEPGILYA